MSLRLAEATNPPIPPQVWAEVTFHEDSPDKGREIEANDCCCHSWAWLQRNNYL